MGFKASELSVLAYANNFTLWHYNAAGLSIADVGRPGFFDKAVDMLRVKDVIFVGADDQVRQVTVTRNAGGMVKVFLPGVFGDPLDADAGQNQAAA